MVLALSFAAFSPVASLCTRTNSCSLRSTPHSQEASLLRQAAEVADLSAGLTAPHPNFGCVIARGTDVVGHGFLYAQGTKCAELQAVEIARELSRGATAYLNLEPGDCYGDLTPVSSLVQVLPFLTLPCFNGFTAYFDFLIFIIIIFGNTVIVCNLECIHSIFQFV